MSVIIRDIVCDNEQRYACSNCGAFCCNNFSVTIDEETKSKYEDDDFLQKIIKKANVKFKKKDNKSFYIPKVFEKSEYKCVFIDNNNLCHIHKEKGYSFKPVTCQYFPFSLYFDIDNNIHIETSFVCESILENNGSLVEDFKTDLIANYVNLEYFPRVYKIKHSFLPQQKLFLLITELKNILDDTTISLNDSILCYSKLLHCYKESFIKYNTTDISALKGRIKDNKNCKSLNIKQHGYIINVYLASLLLYSSYRVEKPLFKNPYRLLYVFVALFAGLSLNSKRLVLPNGFKPFNLNSLNKVKFNHNNKIDLLIRRYLKSSILRYKYTVNTSDDLFFLNNVIIYFHLIHIYSKIQVIVMNKDEVDYETVKQSIKTIEYVFYHLNSSVVPSNIINSLVISHINTVFKKLC